MLMATDGACRRPGTPQCNSVGVTWIQTEQGAMLFKATFETKSSSQRGEIGGLIEALHYAIKNADDEEDIIIITDSEYVCNTVMKRWCYTWKAQNWQCYTGPTVNADQWAKVCILLDKLNTPRERVFVEWTKGHLMSYSNTNVNCAMQDDPTGLELYTRILVCANRDSEKFRIIGDFNAERKKKNKHEIPGIIAIQWVVANVVTDALGQYIMRNFDDKIL